MKLFWARGYTATSLAELLLAMDISRSSFYASFHTKRDLFMECLILFGDRTLDIVDVCQRTRSPLELPRAFFEATLLDVSSRKAKQGCMMVNTVLEMADVDPSLNRLAAKQLTAIESTFAQSFRIAQQNGELSEALCPDELAARVMTINLGLRVQSRLKRSQKELTPMIESSLSMLGLAA